MVERNQGQSRTRRVGNPGKMWVEMDRGQYSDMLDPNMFIPGLPGQAEDPGYPANYWQQKVTDATKRVMQPIADSAYNAWQAYLDQQQHGTLMEKITDPAIARWLGMGRDRSAQAAPPPEAEPGPETIPSGPGGSPRPPVQPMTQAAPPSNIYLEELQKLLMGRGGASPLPRIQGQYPQPPQQTMNVPAYPDMPVPQRGQVAEPNYSRSDEYLEQARPAPYEGSKEDLLIALLGGAAQGFGQWRPGDRMGQQIARAGGAGMSDYLGQKRFQDTRKERSEDDLRRYYMQRGGIEEGRESQRLQRSDRNQEVQYQNESAVREDQFRRADYEIKTQQIQQELANGNWNRAFAIAQAMRQDDRANAQLGMQERAMQMQGLGTMARVQAYANKPTGGGGRTMADLGPGAMTSTIIGNAISKKQPLPGYDISQMQSQALAAMKEDKNLRMLIPGTPGHQAWVDQWVASNISRDLAKNPQKMQQIIQMYAKVPFGSYGGNPINRGLAGDDDE